MQRIFEVEGRLRSQDSFKSAPTGTAGPEIPMDSLAPMAREQQIAAPDISHPVYLLSMEYLTKCKFAYSVIS
jgi:hypothetical protein